MNRKFASDIDNKRHDCSMTALAVYLLCGILIALLANMALRDQIRAGDCFIQSRKNRSIRIGKLNQVTVSGLLWSLNPGGQVRDVMTVRNKCE